MLRAAVPIHPAFDDDPVHASPEPNAAEIRAQLSTILSQPAFNASARNRRFLSYVIEEALQGRSGRIKAYTVALAVFDRNQDFDPLIDPIVRIEASRLRRAIEHYYLTAGKDDPIRIDIPKGSYVPSFSRLHADVPGPPTPPMELSDVAGDGNTALTDAESPSASKHRSKAYPAFNRWAACALVLAAVLAVVLTLAANGYGFRKVLASSIAGMQGPSIYVAPFVTVNDSTKYDYIAAGLTFDIISNLTRFDDFRVYGTVKDPPAGQSNEAANSIIPATDYLLSGSVRNDETSVHLNVLLTDRHTGRYIWALNKTWPLSAENLVQITPVITAEIINTLTQPDGIILEQPQRDISRSR